MTQTLRGHINFGGNSRRREKREDSESVPKRAVVCGSLIAVFASTTIAHAPSAVADPACPVPNQQSARETIDDLEAQGYNVQINWVNGQSYRSLCDCPVLAVHNPNRSGDPPDTFTTVYIDVSCPDHGDDDSGFQFGVGF
jgi:hypothetical protein